MSLSGSSDSEKLADLTSRTHKEQLVWFLNALWNTVGERDAENFWKYSLKCAELDLQNRDRGTALDELNAHVFLEHFNETMTVRQMREQLRSTGAIGATERPKAVPISHILLFKYSADWHSIVNSTQGDNQDEIDEAQRRLNAAKAACDEAVAREAEAVAREAEAAQAKAELEAALADLHAQEEAYNTRTADLTARSETGGVVSRNKAKAELAQHLAEDPLPLRRAKLTTEAAVKKAERTRQAAEAARIEAVASRQAAEAAVQSADQYLQEVKSRSGSAQGAIWFMERELLEARKYLPTSKGGIGKGK